MFVSVRKLFSKGEWRILGKDGWHTVGLVPVFPTSATFPLALKVLFS